MTGAVSVLVSLSGVLHKAVPNDGWVSYRAACRSQSLVGCTWSEGPNPPPYSRRCSRCFRPTMIMEE